MTDTLPRAEFDAFAPDYDGGFGDPLKRLLGGTPEVFFEHKVDWLLRNVAPTGRLLDFGCGTGSFLRALRQSRAPLELVGCDASGGMLAAARERWDAGPLPALYAVAPGQLPFADGEFDVVTVLCVLHHVESRGRPGVIRELLRVLRPGGVVVVIEHNPTNPATRWLVKRAPIDANAELLTAGACTRLLREAGATPCRSDYILFFPPRLRGLWRTERFFARLPIGGQYVTVGTKAPA